MLNSPTLTIPVTRMDWNTRLVMISLLVHLYPLYDPTAENHLHFPPMGILGGYFDGERYSLSGELEYKFRPYVNLSMDGSYNKVIQPKPYNSVDYWLLGPKLDITFTQEYLPGHPGPVQFPARKSEHQCPFSVALCACIRSLPGLHRRLFHQCFCSQKQGRYPQAYLLAECLMLINDCCPLSHCFQMYYQSRWDLR